MYQANKRVGTHETKTRSQVAGSTKKPWRQKGTGRARAGTRKSPLWRGGGTIFGPHVRDYSYDLPRRKRKQALLSALFAKFRDGEVLVVDGLQVEAPSTKFMAGVLKSLKITGRCLVGTAGIDRNLYLSARNIPGVSVAPVRDFNTLDVINAKKILLTREGLDEILSRGGGSGEEATPVAGEAEAPPAESESSVAESSESSEVESSGSPGDSGITSPEEVGGNEEPEGGPESPDEEVKE
jgi:large subunit ribosomal protein L4